MTKVITWQQEHPCSPREIQALGCSRSDPRLSPPWIKTNFWNRDKWQMWKNIRALYVWIWPSLESSVIPLWRWSIGHICGEEIFKHFGLWCLVFPQFLPSGLFVDKEENCVERRTILNLVEMYVIASDLHSIENIVKCALIKFNLPTGCWSPVWNWKEERTRNSRLQRKPSKTKKYKRNWFVPSTWQKYK